MMSKPAYIVVNWTKCAVSGCAATEEEAIEAMRRCVKDAYPQDSYIIAEVCVLSEMKRVES